MLPFGYEIKNGQIVINVKYAEIVRHIYGLYIRGKSVVNITAVLNERDLFQDDHAIKFSRYMTGKILQDQRYTGIKDYPQIIEEHIFKKVQEIRKKKLGKRTNAYGEKGIYPLSGKLFCGLCGSNFNSGYNKKDNIKKWICRGNLIQEKNRCSARVKEFEILQAMTSVIKNIQNCNDILTVGSIDWKSTYHYSNNLWDYKIHAALKHENPCPNIIMNMIFEKASQAYKNTEIEDFKEINGSILSFINNLTPDEENIYRAVNQCVEKIIVEKEHFQFYFKNKIVIQSDRG